MALKGLWSSWLMTFVGERWRESDFAHSPRHLNGFQYMVLLLPPFTEEVVMACLRTESKVLTERRFLNGGLSSSKLIKLQPCAPILGRKPE